MVNRPVIPAWIKSLSHKSYRNIFEFGISNCTLWGTESMLGDWSGRHLLVAKDFYPSSYIEEQIGQGIPNPYRHNPKATTNKNLLKTLRHLGQLHEPIDPANCGFMYVSACFLLRADGKKRSPLPDRDVVMKLSAPVLKFTMENMPNLETVILMGTDADEGFRIGAGPNYAAERRLAVHKVSHPSRAMSDRDRFSEWRPIFPDQAP